MKLLSITAAIVLSAMFCNAQQDLKGYASLSSAWVPAGNNYGWIAMQLTAGREFQGTWFVEYNQTITLTAMAAAPKLIQCRGGMIYSLDRNITLRPFVGYSITSVPISQERRIGHSMCVGASLVQYVARTGDTYIKYELSCNNNFLLIPSIGMFIKF